MNKWTAWAAVEWHKNRLTWQRLSDIFVGLLFWAALLIVFWGVMRWVLGIVVRAQAYEPIWRA
jgi:hypothetical protein